MRGGIGMTENNCTTLNHSENKIFPGDKERQLGIEWVKPHTFMWGTQLLFLPTTGVLATSSTPAQVLICLQNELNKLSDQLAN